MGVKLGIHFRVESRVRLELDILPHDRLDNRSTLIYQQPGQGLYSMLNVLLDLAWRYFPAQYTVHIVIGIASVLALRAYSFGRRTTRERDLHARTVIITVSTPNYCTFDTKAKVLRAVLRLPVQHSSCRWPNGVHTSSH
jgi:hypothetical protein